MKKLLTLVLALLCLAGQRVYADSSGVCGENLTWNLTDGVLTISGAGAMTDWSETAPSPWKESRDEISALVVEDGVTSIGTYAFDSLACLTSVSLPEGVESINDFGFRRCSLLGEITLPASLIFIGESVFQGCESLRDVVIPEKVRSLGRSAFGDCKSLEKIILSDSLETMDYSTFKYCTSLRSVVIPKKVTMIERRLFDGCTALEEVTLPVGLTKIHYQAFQNCNSLKSVIIPGLVTSIGYSAFEGCTSLASVIVGNSTPVGLSDDVFSDLSNTTLYVPAGSKAAYESAAVWNGCKEIVELENITFADANVKEVCLANWDVNADGELSYAEAAAVTDLGLAFSENKEIVSFDELKHFVGLQSIGRYAFNGCASLENVVIPESVDSIRAHAFEECDNLKSLSIPASVGYINDAAIRGADGLTVLTVDPNNKVFDSRGNCNAVIETATNTLVVGCNTSVIPDDVVAIGMKAFRDMTKLTSITIPESVIAIGENAFDGCSSLIEVTVESRTPVQIAYRTFSNARNAILYVPGGSKTAYENATCWNEFGGIVVEMKDVTAYALINPDFSSAANNVATGWQGTAFTAANGKLAEQWNKTFDNYQVLQNMPAGTYILSCQGFYRHGWDANSFQNGTEELLAELYINDSHAKIMSLYADSTYTLDPYTYPNSVDDANTAFNEKGQYKDNKVVYTLTEPGDLQIGVRKTVECAGDWTIFDNFKLEYSGDIRTIELEMGTPYYLKHVATGLYLEGGNHYGTQASLGSVGVDVSFAVGGLSGLVNGLFTIDTKVSNWGYTQAGAPQYLALDVNNGNVYLDQDAQNWTVTCLDNGNYTLKSNDGRYLNSSDTTTALVLGELGAESEWQLVTKEERLADLNVENANELSPVDLTFLFPGAGINQNDLRNENWVGGLTTGGPYENRNAEKWNTASFDINQTVSGLPNGFYRVSVQGFYRVGGGANNPTIAASEYAAGTPTLNAIFYANEASRPLMSIMAEAKTDADSLTEKYYDGLAYGYKTDLGVVPHSQHGAAHFFNEGLYTQSIIAEVVDGTLKVGVKKDVGSTNDWVVFDNFKLEYAGTDCATGTNTVELEEGTPYYLKHVSTGLYLEGGNSWGTQASLGRVGVDVSFANIATSLSGVYGIFTIDTKVSNLGYTQAGAPQYLALDATNGQVYLDQDAQNWTVTRLDNGNYTLKCNDGRYLNSAEGSSALVLGELGAESEWQMVTKEERLADLPIEDAGELSPVDLTFMLPGAGLNQNDLRNENWVGGLTTGGSYENINAEKWNTASFDINQTISGLPDGYYRVSVQGFYRVGGGENNPTIAASEYAAGTPTLNAIFYANEASRPLMSIMADARTDADSLTEKYYNDLTYGYKTDLGVVPHCQHGASYFFNRGFYTQSIIARVVDGTLKVGVKKDVSSTNDWVVFDNFKLEYMGTESVTGAFTVDLKEDTSYYLKHVSTGLYLEGGYSWGTQASLGRVGVDVSFTNVETSLSGVYGIFTIDTKVSNIGYTQAGAPQYLALDATNGNVYLDQDIQNWTVTRLANGNYTLKCNDGRYLNSAEGSAVLVLGELGAESEWQMVTKEERLASLDIKNASELSPVDLTFMFPGADFDQNDTRNGNWEGNPKLDGPYENRNAEKWYAASFDINQTVSGLPNGFYRIFVQGFYRVGGDGTTHSAIVSANEYAAGNPTLNAIFYANGASKPLMSIMAEAKADADSLTTISSGGNSYGYKTDLGVVPNSQYGAAIFFNEGLYTQSIIAEVVDGTLKVGVKKDVAAGDDWVVFDNFGLYYMGTEITEITDIVLDNSSLQLGAGETATLVATVTPDNAIDKSVTWKTSDGSVATVDATGKVTAVGPGTATITATAGTCSATCVVTVKVYWTFDEETGHLYVDKDYQYESRHDYPWHSFREAIKSVELSSNVTSIGASAFNRCSSLTSITIPTSVTSIGKHAFYGCTSLTGVEIPAGVTSIGEYAFNGCSSLTSIVIPDGVTRIGSLTFTDCTSLMSVTIPTSVTSIGSSAFSWCTSLTDITIPASVTSIGSSAFRNCTSLTGFTIPAGVTGIEKYTFYGCTSLASITIHDGITSIEEYAFTDCENLKTVFNLSALDIVKGADTHGMVAYYADKVQTTMVYLDYFILNDTTMRAGQSMLLPVTLNNEHEFTAFQCDVYLPEGITLQTNKGKYDITLDEERMNDQTITSALQEDGSIRMAVASLTSSLFSGNSGNLFYLNLLGGENISGNLAISIKNIHISAVDGTMYDLEDVTATITVPSYTPADVNDDGMIAINDVVLTINAVLGTYADNFVFAAADMNGDNQIMINDVVQVINSVLGLNTTSVLTARHIVRETLDINETRNGFGMSLSNAGGYVAMQYDMTLPAGVSINDIRVASGSNHSVSFREVGDGQVRVAVVSLTNEAFASGSLLEVSVSAESATSISITNAYVATRRGVMVEVADAEVQLTRGGATGIQAVGVEVAPADIFDLSGRIVKKAATSLEGLDKGVYLMNGKKVVVK